MLPLLGWSAIRMIRSRIRISISQMGRVVVRPLFPLGVMAQCLRRVLLLRVYAVMVAASLTGPFFGFHCSELPSVGFLIIPFRVRAFHLFGPVSRSVLPRLVQTFDKGISLSNKAINENFVDLLCHHWRINLYPKPCVFCPFSSLFVQSVPLLGLQTGP